MGDLLLRGRSASDRVEAFEVDGLDDKFCAPECYPGYVAVDRPYRCPSAPRQNIGRWQSRRVDYRSRLHRCFVHNMRPSLFTHGMKATLGEHRSPN